MMMAPGLQACQIAALQFDSGNVVGGDLITGSIRLPPPCQDLLTQGLMRLEVIGDQGVLPGTMVSSGGDLPPGVVRFRVPTAQVSARTPVQLTIRLVVSLPLSSSFIVSSDRAVIQLTPTVLFDLQFPNFIAATGQPVTGTVTLQRPAPPGGVTINLFSGRNDFLRVPPSVTIPEGATSATFQATPTADLGIVSAAIFPITARHGGIERQSELRLEPIRVTEVTVSPNPVVGGSPVAVTVRFNTFLTQPEMVLVRVGAQSATASLANGQTFNVAVPTDRVQAAGEQATVPVTVTVRGRTVTAPTPLVLTSLPELVIAARAPRPIGLGLTRFLMT